MQNVTNVLWVRLLLVNLVLTVINRGLHAFAREDHIYIYAC